MEKIIFLILLLEGRGKIGFVWGEMKKIFLAFFGLAMISPIFAQEEIPNRHVRLIPLGDLPKWEEELRNGIRTQLPPPLGSVPPSSVSFRKGGDAGEVRLMLGQISDYVTFKGNAEKMAFYEGAVPGEKSWVESPLPTSVLSLGVLFRDPAEKTWQTPRMLVWRDDVEAFPLEQIRFVNVSVRTVIVQLGKERPFTIEPGKAILKPLTVGTNPMNVGYLPPGGGAKSIFKNEMPLRQGDRVQCFFYQDLTDEPRDEVKFVFQAEGTPRPPSK